MVITGTILNVMKALVLFIPDIFMIFLLAIRPTSIWRFTGFTLYTCIATFLLLTVSTGDSLQDYLNGCTVARSFLTAVYLFWFTDPLSDFRHETDIVHPRELPFRRRLYWSACLTYNLCGVGWNYQVHLCPTC
jgi:hypothetical protein